MLISSAVRVRCVQGTVGGSVLREKGSLGGFTEKGIAVGRTGSRHQACRAGERGPDREQAVKRPGSLKQHVLFWHRR